MLNKDKVEDLQSGSICEPAVSQTWKTDSIYNNLVLLDWRYIRQLHTNIQNDRLSDVNMVQV